MSHFAIAGVQMQVYMQKNIDAMAHRLDLLMEIYPWVQMVMFSELAVYGPALHHAQEIPGSAEESFQRMAAKYGIWLLTGSMFEKRGDQVYNTASVIDPQGTVVGRYRKLFAFLPYEKGVTGGDEFLVFDVADVGRFGVSICYDMWLPETSRTLTAMGAEVILHPVLTHGPDRDVDLAIARSTAAMFQCYVFDINGLVAGGNGRSSVFDPSGRLLYEADVQEQLIPIEIDLSVVRRERERGLRGLGQPLKSFRDRTLEFDVYDRSRWQNDYLHSLGPLAKPERGVVPGLQEVHTHRAAAREAGSNDDAASGAGGEALSAVVNSPSETF